MPANSCLDARPLARKPNSGYDLFTVTPESDATLWNIEAKQCSHSAHPVGVYPYKADWYNSNCDFEEDQVTLTKSGGRRPRSLSLDFDEN